MTLHHDFNQRPHHQWPNEHHVRFLQVGQTDLEEREDLDNHDGDTDDDDDYEYYDNYYIIGGHDAEQREEDDGQKSSDG